MAYLLGAAVVAGGLYAAMPAPARPARAYIAPGPDELGKYQANEKVYTIEPDQGLPIRYAQKGLAARKFGTLIELMEESVKKVGNTPALKYEKPGYPADKPGEWEVITWQQYRDQVRRFAKALIGIDFQPYKGVAICGFNGPFWFIAHMGVTYAVGLSAGTYTTNTPEACKYVADHSHSEVVVVDNVKTLQKYLAVKLDSVRHIVVAQEDVPADIKSKYGDYVLGWEEFMSKGDKVTDAQLESRMALAKVENACTLIYTSGTTGNPKAVMASHDNMQFGACSGIFSAIPDLKTIKEWHYISYLPLSHIAAQMLDIVIPMIITAESGNPFTVSFARPDALKGTLGLTLKAVRPTFFFGVPRVWEKIAEGIKAKAKEAPATGLKLKLVTFAKRVGLECSENRQVGGSGAIPRGYGIANKLVYSKVKAALGLDRCTNFVTAAAPIQRETLNFFASLGMDITEVYGMSETIGNGTAGCPDRFKFGCTGAPMLAEELKLDHNSSRDKPGEGEICYRGRHVMMGYLRNEEKTRETIDPEGWLHSGDVGKFDETMQLSITGRIKELIIGAGGENIAPIPIEDEIKRLCPALSNCVMIGDKRKYNVVLVSLKARPNLETGEFYDDLLGDALEVNKAVKTVSAARSDPTFAKTIEEAIKKYNNGSTCVSNAQKVQKFAILPTDLSIPGGELTGTLKIKRNVVTEKYADLIESLY